MNATEKELLESLRDLDQKVQAISKEQSKPDLIPLFTRLDELTAKLPRGTDPTLLHYLHKKSYDKARRYLEGRDDENQVGSCR